MSAKAFSKWWWWWWWRRRWWWSRGSYHVSEGVDAERESVEAEALLVVVGGDEHHVLLEDLEALPLLHRVGVRLLEVHFELRPLARPRERVQLLKGRKCTKVKVLICSASMNKYSTSKVKAGSMRQ